MMGAGLYTLLGLAGRTAGVWLPLSFLLAGIAALFSVYSYARLGATYPSRGGAAQFLLEEFGRNVTSGGLNVFQYLAYIIATSLYAAGFAEYVAALAGDGFPSWATKLVGAAVVVVFAAVNSVGSRLVGRAETVIVGVEAAILVGFVILGAFKADPSRLTSGGTPTLTGVVTGAALLYVTYQGFGVVTNAAGGMADPRRQLPRAMFGALGIVAVVYLAVSTLVVTLLDQPTIEQDAGHVLADVGQVVAGRTGFVIIAAAALLATASAVNATLFAASNIGYVVADNSQMPSGLRRSVGRGTPVALLLSAGLAVALVVAFPLSAVGQMTSLAFLVLYGAVSLGHLRLRQATGARAWPLVSAVTVNAVLFVALLVDAVRHASPATWITLVAALGGSFAFEAWWLRRHTPAPSPSGAVSKPAS
jgi:amino acid transporter